MPWASCGALGQRVIQRGAELEKPPVGLRGACALCLCSAACGGLCVRRGWNPVGVLHSRGDGESRAARCGGDARVARTHVCECGIRNG